MRRVGIGVCHRRLAAPDVASCIDILSIGPLLLRDAHQLVAHPVGRAKLLLLRGRVLHVAEKAPTRAALLAG